MNASSIDPLLLQTSSHLHSSVFEYRGFHIAGLCLLVWDYLLTLDLEIEFFWSLSSGKKLLQLSTLRILFFLNRYLPIATQLFVVIGLTYANVSDQFAAHARNLTCCSSCNILIKHIVHIAMVVQWFAIPGAVLCYRTCALYKGEKHMVGGIVVSYLASVMASAFIVGFAAKRGEAVAHLDPSVGLKVCHGIIPDKTLYAAFIAPAVYDVAVSFLAMYAILRHRRHSHTMHSNQLMNELAKGTVAWLLVVVSSDILNLCIFAFVSTTMRHVFDGIMFAIISIASNRQLLHLREIGSRKTDQTSTHGSATLPVHSPIHSPRYKTSFGQGSLPTSPTSPRTFAEKVGLTSALSNRSLPQQQQQQADDVPMTPLSSPSGTRFRPAELEMPGSHVT
ncbi:hypothetical protein BKA62DRAFT_675555 [Auriculariales sp. MPI-PUGE-AT-0066]|nr:hypothetical protein BKA62DRAFT_675555 [Auriculariales sp. MPI-PUGE-AT-0066]